MVSALSVGVGSTWAEVVLSTWAISKWSFAWSIPVLFQPSDARLATTSSTGTGGAAPTIKAGVVDVPIPIYAPYFSANFRWNRAGLKTFAFLVRTVIAAKAHTVRCMWLIVLAALRAGVEVLSPTSVSNVRESQSVESCDMPVVAGMNPPFHNLEILQSVVMSNLVDMMYNFVWQQFPAQVLFHEPPMFSNGTAELLASENDVPTPIDASRSHFHLHQHNITMSSTV